MKVEKATIVFSSNPRSSNLIDMKFLCIAIVLLSPTIRAQDSSALIYVSTKPEQVVVQGKMIKTTTLRSAIKQVSDGGTIRLLPGVYREDLDFHRAAEPKKPITIEGEGAATSLSCSAAKERPEDAMIRLQGASHLIWKNIHFNCARPLFYASDARSIEFHQIQSKGGGSFLIARGETTHDFSLQDSQIGEECHADSKNVSSHIAFLFQDGAHGLSLKRSKICSFKTAVSMLDAPKIYGKSSSNFTNEGNEFLNVQSVFISQNMKD